MNADAYLAFKKRRMLDPHLGAIDHWPRTYKALERLILESDANLFQQQIIQIGMYLTTDQRWQRAQIPYLKTRYTDVRLRDYLREEPTAPYPIITEQEFATTESRVNHLTHLASFHEKTGIDPIGMECVVEFGAGYGGMCALMRARTHIVIDLPVMLFLQAWYLGNRCGDRVNLILDESQPIKRGAINLLPVHFEESFDSVRALTPDLMVSTWSLSESGPDTKRGVAGADFWSARHILNGSNGRTPAEYFSGYEVLHDEQTFYSPSDYYLFLKRR